MLNSEKENRPKYNLNDFRTWGNYDADEKKLKIIEDVYCINCQEFRIPTKEGKCPNCKAQLKKIILSKTSDNLKEMGVELKETQNTGKGALW